MPWPCLVDQPRSKILRRFWGVGGGVLAAAVALAERLDLANWRRLRGDNRRQFLAQLRQWRNHILWAEIQGGRPNFPEYKPHWWKAQPLESPLPLFTFMINEKAPKPDNYNTSTLFDLYSPRLISIFREAGIQFETFPAQIIDRKTKKPLDVTYEIFHLLEMAEGIDLEKSDYDVDSPYDTRHLVMADERLYAGKLLFRDREFMDLVLMRADLKHELDQANITGCRYTLVEEYVVGKLAWEQYVQNAVAEQERKSK